MRVRSAPSTVTPQSRSRAIFSRCCRWGLGWEETGWRVWGRGCGEASAENQMGSRVGTHPQPGGLAVEAGAGLSGEHCPGEHSVEGEAWLPQKLFVAWGEWRNHAEPLSVQHECEQEPMRLGQVLRK